MRIREIKYNGIEIVFMKENPFNEAFALPTLYYDLGRDIDRAIEEYNKGINASGFNIPREVLYEFFSIEKPNDLQAMIMDTIGNLRGNYIITYMEDSKKSTKKHERSHLMYYNNPDYRNDSQGIISKIPQETSSKINNFLMRYYHPILIQDETVAYMAELLNFRGRVDLTIREKLELSKISREMRKCFDHYWNL